MHNAECRMQNAELGYGVVSVGRGLAPAAPVYLVLYLRIFVSCIFVSPPVISLAAPTYNEV